MISATALRMAFGKTEALRGLDLQIDAGELFALIGPDGAGKTTFFRLVAGLLKPTRGALKVAPIRTFGLVPQRFGLYEDLTVDENLTLRAPLVRRPDGRGAGPARRISWRAWGSIGSARASRARCPAA